jgi:hypothetical protein
VTVVDPAQPAVTEISPELATVKSKLLPMVLELENHARSSGLGFMLLLKAIAFTSVLVVSVKEPLYFLDDWVGVEPSVV